MKPIKIMENKNIKFAFFGTPALASVTLDILNGHGYIPSVIVTSPDRPAGRGMHMSMTHVAEWAEKNHITCLKPEKIDDDFIKEFEKFGVELSIVVAYGKILPENLIKMPELGTINIHYSLLPKYRGASPVEQALLHGDEMTGVSIQQMEFKMDSGPIIVEKETHIHINETKDLLISRLTVMGGELLCEILPDIINKNIKTKAQDESGATYCKKIKKEDGQIDPNGSALENWNKYRAYFGWPGVYFFKNDKRIKITKARFEEGSFIIEKVIPEGKKETDYKNI